MQCEPRDVFYDPKRTISIEDPGKCTPIKFRVGFSPDQRKFVTIRKSHPKFVFTGDNLDELINDTKQAIRSYLNRGLELHVPPMRSTQSETVTFSIPEPEEAAPVGGGH